MSQYQVGQKFILKQDDLSWYYSKEITLTSVESTIIWGKVTQKLYYKTEYNTLGYLYEHELERMFSLSEEQDKLYCKHDWKSEYWFSARVIITCTKCFCRWEDLYGTR